MKLVWQRLSIWVTGQLGHQPARKHSLWNELKPRTALLSAVSVHFTMRLGPINVDFTSILWRKIVGRILKWFWDTNPCWEQGTSRNRPWSENWIQSVGNHIQTWNLHKSAIYIAAIMSTGENHQNATMLGHVFASVTMVGGSALQVAAQHPNIATGLSGP